MSHDMPSGCDEGQPDAEHPRSDAEALLSILADTSRPAHERAAAAHALGHLADEEAIAPVEQAYREAHGPLIRAMHDADDDVHAAAAAALGKLGLRLDREWESDRPTITAPDALARIAQAVAAGPIFGRHYHYKGGRSGDNWAFQTFAAFQDYLACSRPGDLYHVWSLPALLQRQVALMAVQFGICSDAEMIPLVERGLWAVKTYLDVPFNEFLALYLRAGNTAIEVYLSDVDGFDELLEDVDGYSRPDDEIYVFPFTLIDADDYYLVQGKYPNAEGKVPVAGAY